MHVNLSQTNNLMLSLPHSLLSGACSMVGPSFP